MQFFGMNVILGLLQLQQLYAANSVDSNKPYL